MSLFFKAAGMLLIPALFAAPICHAVTDTATYYLDHKGIFSTPGDAMYMRKAWKQNELQMVRDYYASGVQQGQLQMTGAYIDDSFKVKQGPFVYYNTEGIVSAKHLYRNGKQEGLSEMFYESGKPESSVQHRNDMLNGTEKAFYESGALLSNASYVNDSLDGKGEWYYENGQLSAEELYQNGKKIKGIYYSEDGARLKHVREDEITTMAQYKGNVNRFLSTHLHYPEHAREAGIEGRVVLRFVIDETGAVTRIKVVKHVTEELDREAVRVVASMPLWKPGIWHHVKREVYFSLPITFRLK